MTRPEQSTFLVIGGGIGGLTSALALARDGRQVRVLERAPVFEEVGAGLQVGPNASRALDHLGILDAVTTDAFFPNRLVLRDATTGASLTALETGERFQQRFGYRYFVTHRADLHRAVYTACEDTGLVELLPNKHVVDIESLPAGAAVRCADGTEYVTEALIAADGLHSLARELLVDDGAPVDSGYVAYRGTVPIEALAEHGGLREPDGMVIWVGPSQHLVQYPVRRGELCNQVATFDTRRYTGHADDLGRQLVAAFAGTCPEVTAGISLIDTSRRWAMLDRAPSDGWTRDHIALIGDAAHPMLQYLAQGACQAIEDSTALAWSLREHADDTEAAFKAYESSRAPRVARVQTTARKWGEILHIDGIGADLRAALLSQRTADDFEPVDWLYGFDPITTDLATETKRTVV